MPSGEIGGAVPVEAVHIKITLKSRRLWEPRFSEESLCRATWRWAAQLVNQNSNRTRTNDGSPQAAAME